MAPSTLKPVQGSPLAVVTTVPALIDPEMKHGGAAGNSASNEGRPPPGNRLLHMLHAQQQQKKADDLAAHSEFAKVRGERDVGCS